MAQALSERACAKLRSAIADEAVVRLNLTDDLGRMLTLLEYIQPVVEKAEMRPWTGVMMNWLQSVSRVSYRVMDMVDELQDTRTQTAATMTRMLHCHVIKKNSMTTKVVDVSNEVITLKRNSDYYISIEESKITQQRRQVIDEKITGQVFEGRSFCGRVVDKQRIVAALLSAESNITRGCPSCIILPIYGIAGSGKTTLAQMVFNDSLLKKYNFHIWVHVSPNLDFTAIGESILSQVHSGKKKVLCQGVSGLGGQEEINGHGSSSGVLGMESIMKRLHELLNGTKMLLVLDDLWEEDSIQLQLLKSMLTFLGDKVDVIVTTCNQAIARKICTLVQPYRLNPLGDDVCWEIIKKLICFEEEHEEFDKIGLEIARKCWGLPSAARVYGQMLDSQDPRTWTWITNIDPYDYLFSKNLESPMLISTLELSYRSMPPYLRLCFAYCSAIFPIGHNIVKDDLIHQWIAVGHIEPSETSSATEIAEGYITRLLELSFFQTAKWDPAGGKEYKGAIMFTMHHLVHDFARRFLECLSYYLATDHHGKLGDFNDCLSALRCIHCSRVEFNDDSFSRKKYLHVLELKESSVLKLPDSICNLRHLGYLKISEFYGLITLPESVGCLTSLFHIDLSSCSGLVNLPDSFGKLIRLVHVNLSGCSGLTTLPESFGNLVNLLHIDLSRCHRLSEILETLKKLIKLVYLDLSSWCCFRGIDKCLGGLTNLEHLNLSNPCCYLARHRSNLQQLKYGLCKLTRLRYLNLSMCLNPILCYHKSQEESLKYIQSCVSGLSSLEHLDLSHNTFLAHLPQSLGNLDKLHTLDLSGCIRLKKLGEMKALRFIALRNCRSLESCNFAVRVIDDGDSYRSSSNIIQLEDVDCEVLQISCLEKVRSKEEAQRIKLVEKQKLEKLKLSWTLDSVRSVEDGALLRELTPPLHVQCLELIGYDGTHLPEYLGDLASLQELKIKCCKQLISLPDSIRKLSNLKDLLISDCPGLEKWCKLDENKKMLPHVLKKNHEEHASTSRPEIKEDSRLFDEMEAA